MDNQNLLGRPKIQIDFTLLERLATMLCTSEEITFALGVSESTLSRRIQEEYGCTFEDLRRRFASQGKISLRRVQFEKALSGSVPMMIFLGKQYLGQSEKPEGPSEPRVFTLAYSCGHCGKD